MDKTALAEAGGCVPDIMYGLQGLKGVMEASFITGIMGLWSERHLEAVWGPAEPPPRHSGSARPPASLLAGSAAFLGL